MEEKRSPRPSLILALTKKSQMRKLKSNRLLSSKFCSRRYCHALVILNSVRQEASSAYDDTIVHRFYTIHVHTHSYWQNFSSLGHNRTRYLYDSRAHRVIGEPQLYGINFLSLEVWDGDEYAVNDKRFFLPGRLETFK